MKNPQYEHNLKYYFEKTTKNNEKILKENLEKMDIEHEVLIKI